VETELTSEQSECLLSDIREYVSKNYCSCLVGVLQSELEKQADQVLRLMPNNEKAENSHTDSQLATSEVNGGENNAR
ncbi:ABC transporter ATP-binding protein, partial [Gardnerella vaginalis]